MNILFLRRILRQLLILILLNCQADIYAEGNFDVLINSSPATEAKKDGRLDYYPPTREEQNQNFDVMNKWVAQAFQKPNKEANADKSVTRPSAPFSFVYGGVSSYIFLDSWDYSVHPSENAHFYVVSYTDPMTKLKIDCEVRTYPDAAAVDWVCYLTNTGDKDSPIIENFMPLDSTSLFGSDSAKGVVTLRWSNGDRCTRMLFFIMMNNLSKTKLANFKAIHLCIGCQLRMLTNIAFRSLMFKYLVVA